MSGQPQIGPQNLFPLPLAQQSSCESCYRQDSQPEPRPVGVRGALAVSAAGCHILGLGGGGDGEEGLIGPGDK